MDFNSILKNLDLFSVGVVVYIISIFGFIVFYNNKKSVTNRTFLFFSLITSVWGLFNYLHYQIDSVKLSFWLLKLVMFFAVWQAFFIFKFFYLFPKEEFHYPKWYRFILVPAVIITSALTLTPLVLNKVLKLSADGKIIEVANGPGIVLFGLLSVGLVLTGLLMLFKNIFQAKGEKRKPLRTILLGTSLTFSLIITFNFILPAFFANARFIPLGAAFMLPFVFFTSYAMAKHHLLNVKLIATEIVVTILVLILLFEGVASGSVNQVMFKILFAGLVGGLGILLIKSVLKEVQLREREEHLNHQLAQANEQLKELLQMKSEFLDIASHQLRTPLSAMIGLLSMQYDGDFGTLSKTEQKEQQKNMLVSAERLRGIVNDLMDAMEVEGGIKPKLTKTDVEKLVSEAINTLKPNYDKKGLYLNYEKPAASLPQVSADKTFLAQVFMNLIDNACQYTEQGGVAIKLFPEQNGVTFEIKDSGMGISEKEKKRMFGKFERSQRAKLIHPDGSGLGLFIVKKIVDAHGGKIETQSAGEGQGATFKVWLPAAAAIPVIDNNLITIKS